MYRGPPAHGAGRSGRTACPAGLTEDPVVRYEVRGWAPPADRAPALPTASRCQREKGVRCDGCQRGDGRPIRA
jgi:hypothetical protein